MNFTKTWGVIAYTEGGEATLGEATLIAQFDTEKEALDYYLDQTSGGQYDIIYRTEDGRVFTTDGEMVDAGEVAQ